MVIKWRIRRAPKQSEGAHHGALQGARHILRAHRQRIANQQHGAGLSIDHDGAGGG